MDETHADLVELGKRWLRRNGCRVVLSDPFRASVQSGEQPDVIGWRDGLSLLIEVKVSRADFLRDRHKRFRKTPETGMGDWRFYLAPADIISIADLPDGWGLLQTNGRKVDRVHGGPKGNAWWHSVPFLDRVHKRNETSLLISALAQPDNRPVITRKASTSMTHGPHSRHRQAHRRAE